MWRDFLKVRDDRDAKRVAVIALASPAAVLFILGIGDYLAGYDFVMLAPLDHEVGSYAHAHIIPVALWVTAWLISRAPEKWAKFWIFAVTVSSSWVIALICILALERSASVQVMYLLPVVLAGYTMTVPAVCFVMLNTFVAHCFHLHQVSGAIFANGDLVNMSVTLTAAVIALFMARRSQESAREQLEYRASKDDLTGLWTRRKLDHAVAHWDSKEQASLLIIDVDKFKSVNDQYGHLAGDALLKQVATVLTDNAGEDDLACRLGGDEFAVFYPHLDGNQAAQRAWQIVAAARENAVAVAGGKAAATTLSIGVANVAESGGDVERLYAIADGAMYQSKKAGRDAVHIYRDDKAVPFVPTQSSGASSDLAPEG